MGVLLGAGRERAAVPRQRAAVHRRPLHVHGSLHGAGGRWARHAAPRHRGEARQRRGLTRRSLHSVAGRRLPQRSGLGKPVHHGIRWRAGEPDGRIRGNRGGLRVEGRRHDSAQHYRADPHLPLRGVRPRWAYAAAPGRRRPDLPRYFALRGRQPLRNRV
jgi:hypothetical protein